VIDPVSTRAGPADDRTLRLLDFDRVLGALADGTVTPMGKALALNLRPTADTDVVRAALAETTEANAIASEAEIPVRGARDLDPLVTRAAAGASLEEAELLDVAQTLEVARRLQGYLRARSSRAPRLADLGDLLAVHQDLEADIGRAIDERAQIRDGASPDLKRIRDETRSADRRLRESMDKVVRDPVLSRYLQDAIVTSRSQRYVVPVKAEHRAQFPGIVHDASASGATLFMEPLAVVPLGNQRRELEAAEREEIARILRWLSGRVGEAAGNIRRNGELIAMLDLAAAKAALSARLAATEPAVEDGAGTGFQMVRLEDARHAVLVLLRGRDAVVPLDVTLGGESRTLVVTGPNTGGKTIVLKTIGLCAVMAQSGLHIPAREGSALPVFARVHADIGDEQSVAQNLSTFSSHLSAIVRMFRDLETPALVLLDEVGAGTDPAEGVALARAIIETLHERGAYTVVTTHYNELKMLASMVPGIENASVEFNPETLQPTFRLRVGVPGRSNALIIAERLGLDPAIVGSARAHLAPEQVAIEQVLDDLTRDRQAAERDRAEAAVARQSAQVEAARLAAEVERLRSERRRLLADARRASEAIVEETRRRLDAAMAEVKSSRTEASVRQARATLQSAIADLPAADVAPPVLEGEPVTDVRVGMSVIVAALGKVGVVRGEPDAKDEVEVEVGPLRTRVPRAVLRLAPEPQRRAEDRVDVPVMPGVPTSLSVRGQTVDEALLVVDRYLDDAVRARMPQVTIIHGKGTGALRRALHDFLRGHPHVQQYRIGVRGEGDTGATVVTLSL
jgi:DNA mismatch repair protein MutS2